MMSLLIFYDVISDILVIVAYSIFLYIPSYWPDIIINMVFYIIGLGLGDP